MFISLCNCFLIIIYVDTVSTTWFDKTALDAYNFTNFTWHCNVSMKFLEFWWSLISWFFDFRREQAATQRVQPVRNEPEAPPFNFKDALTGKL